MIKGEHDVMAAFLGTPQKYYLLFFIPFFKVEAVGDTVRV